MGPINTRFMKVEVKLYGILRKYRPSNATGAPHHAFTLDLPEAISIQAVANALALPDGYVNATAINGETATLDTPLQNNDKVSFFPPSAGGTSAGGTSAGENEPLRIFFSGIMQATRSDDQIEDQHYRVRLRQAFQTCLPDIHITDPWAENPGSVNYGEEKARHTFLSMVRSAKDVDLLVAYIPVASMGSAMEMWHAFENGVYVITISPMKHHWAIRFSSHEIFPDLDTFLDLLQNGRFINEYIPKILAHTRQS